MIDEATLHRLEELAPKTPPRSIEELQRRAGAIHRHRRTARRAGATGLLVTALAVGGTTLPALVGGHPGGQHPSSGTASLAQNLLGAPAVAAAAAAGGCTPTTGFVAELPPADAGHLIHLFSSDPPGLPLNRVRSSRTTMDCAPGLPAAVLIDQDESTGRARRGLTVWRAASNPWTDPPRGQTVGVPIDRHVKVRGTTGALVTFPGGNGLALSWTDPDDVDWLVQAAGIPRQQLIGMVDRMTVSTVGVPGSLPDGFRSVPIPRARPSRTSHSWDVVYGQEDNSDGGGAHHVALGVSDDVTPPVEYQASINTSPSGGDLRYVTVDGTAAQYLKLGPFGSLTWQENGQTFQLNGARSLAVLRSLAAGIEPASPTDPRILSALAVPPSPSPSP